MNRSALMGLVVVATTLMAAGCDTVETKVADATIALDAGAGGADAPTGADTEEPDPDVAIDAATPCADCGPDQVCVGERCIQAPSCGCEFGEFCVGEGLCRPGCRRDEDCGLGRACNENTCVPFCTSDEDCAVSSACVDAECRARCAGDEDCAGGEACVEQICLPVACLDTVDCPVGHACRENECIFVGRVSCASSADCGDAWSCEPLSSLCVRCQQPSDCPDHLTCANFECVLPELPNVRFERARDTGLEAHLSGWDPDDLIGFGRGAALLDWDGDGWLDIALGSDAPDGQDVCVFRNTSQGGDLRFAPVDDVCAAGFRGAGVFGADLFGDSRDELLVGDAGQLRILSAARPPVTLIPDPETPGLASCVAGAFAPIDIDFDGDLDLYVGCQVGAASARNRPEERRNLVFIHDGTGEFHLLDGPMAEQLADAGVTLAIGLHDLDDDGLIDMTLANDSFSTTDLRNLTLEPGRTYRRCAPTESCDWDVRLVSDDDTAWGSFMGVGDLWVGDERMLFLSDWGRNMLFPASAAARANQSEQTGLALATRDGVSLFTWSAVVDDFDFDGRDDVLLTHGKPDPFGEGHLSHQNLLALQREAGSFSTYDRELGLLSPAERDSIADGVVPGSRAALKADFDQDGRLDVLILNQYAAVELYSETTSRPRRCTLDIEDPMAPVVGYGVWLGTADDPRWRQRDIQGHIRSGQGSDFVTSGLRGVVRLPSGAAVPYDCGTATRLAIIGPEWISAQWDDGAITVEIDVSALESGAIVSASVAAVLESGRVVELPLDRDPNSGLWVARGSFGYRRAMVRLNGRWIPRWFEAP